LVYFYWIDSKLNPVDIVSKHWGYQQVWDLLHSGDTSEIIKGEGMKNSGGKLVQKEDLPHVLNPEPLVENKGKMFTLPSFTPMPVDNTMHQPGQSHLVI
jgi:hypothetical protein